MSEEIEGSSNRVFGLVFTGFFALLALAPLRKGLEPRLWALALAGALLSAALLSPDLLAPLNRLWTSFGLLLQKITNPVITSVLFFVVITPAALVLKLLGKDPLHRRPDPEKTSYWIARDSDGTNAESMRHQF